MHSLKMMPQGVGTFSTIEDLILRTLIFRHFLDPRSLTPKARPALRKAGRTFSKSGSFVSKSRPDHPRRVQKLASQRKARPALRKAGRTFQIRPPKRSATRLAKGRSHFSNSTSKKERDPPCRSQKAAKARNISISPGARQVAPTHSPYPLQDTPWSYWE